MVTGMAAMTVSVLALAVFVRPDSSYLVLVGPLLVAGVGTVAFQLGAALGVSLVSAVFSSAGGYASAATFVDGLRPALVAVGVVTAIGVAAVNRFRGTVATGGQAADTTVRLPNRVPDREPADQG
jgi:hypothetical protein